MKKKSKKSKRIFYKKENKFLFWALALAIFGILIFFSFQLYLYLKFIIGHDIIVKLDASKKDLFLKNGQSETIELKIRGVANPLCKMKCYSILQDLSNNLTISEDNFYVKQNQEKKTNITLEAKGESAGQELYRFSVECHNIKSLFCHTEEKPTTRTILFTLNRELSETQKETKREIKNKLENAINNFSIIEKSLPNLEKNLLKLDEVIETNHSQNKIKLIKKESFEIEKEINEIKILWEEQNFSNLKKETSNFENKISLLNEEYAKLNASIFNNFSEYNKMVEILKNYSEALEKLSIKKYNLTDAEKLNEIIKNFNEKITSFKKERKIEEKNKILNQIIEQKIEKFFIYLYNDTNYTIDEKVNFSLIFIFPEFTNLSVAPFKFDEPPEKCCVFRNCSPCCKEPKCANENYPILLLHGHDFDKSISAEYSVNIFEKLQTALDKDGFIKAGEIYYSYKGTEKEKILGKSNKVFTFRGSYYFDVLTNGKDYMPVQMKSENIDTYAIRLKELIEKLKYETGKNKVTIIAHSMGGLVARRYVQIFGGESVDKMILVAVPNKGITADIRNYCSFFGEELECRDMDENSVFINKLNREENEKVEIYNIIGRGCSMKGGDGDGIVLVKNAILEKAKENYFINGKCSSINLLHGEEILNNEKHPEVYAIIKNILLNNR